MANNSFFYGATPSPEANTVDELIDSLEDKVAIAGQSNTDAITAAAQAAESATNARVSELAAADIVVTSNANVGAAAASAQTALDAATAASNSATNSANTAAASNTSASNSATSATAAATSATNASSSATSASGSATTATTKAAEAATSATNASNSASAASSSASTATTQAGVATTQAGIATTQAGIATTQATAAASSATAASGSASAASTSASSAATSATNSAASATQSANSATASSASSVTSGTSATAAATSATNAATSATQAASSAASATAIVTGVNSSRPSISPSLNLDFANTETLDPRITFTRASTATYYGTRTAVAEQNLALQSQTFENVYWGKTNCTASANTTTAPDGTTTADTITENTATAAHLVQSAQVPYVRNTTFTISVYAKPNGKTQFLLGMTSGGGGQADFLIDLTAFTATFNFNNAGVTSFSGTATDVGSGWCRATITFTTPNSSAGDSGTAVFWLGNSKSYTGDGTSGLFFWGAQLEQRSTVTAYTPTTTQPITNYIPVLETAASNVARFDHNPVTFESLGLLIEEQRTNLLTYSEQFDNAAWTKSNATVTANTIVSPDGTLDADKLVEGTTTARKYALQTGAASGRTFSVYAKAGGRNFISIGSTNGGGLWGVSQFNLSTGVFVNAVSVGGEAAPTSPTITSVGNGWYRVSVLLAGSSTSAVIMVTNGGDPVFEGYTGNGFDGIYIWGAQLEAGAFSTSYIPTVASQVTRAADNASMTGTNFTSWYNAAEGTLYVESLTQNINFSNNKNLQLNDGTINNEIWIGSGSPPTSSRSQITLGGVGYFASSLTNQVTAGQFGKYAISFETNNAVLCANGTLGTVDTDVPIPSSINQLTIIPPQRAGYYKKIAYYPVAVTSAQLQALTG